MGTVRYTVIEGEVVSELRGGVKRDYVPDPLGSTVALLDSTQTITDTFQYWPYGENAARTGTTATPFQYVGTYGYYRDISRRNYVRARYLDITTGRWITEDSIGFDSGDYNIYRYVANNPVKNIDPTGYETYTPCSGRIRNNCIQYCRSKGREFDSCWIIVDDDSNITINCNCKRYIGENCSKLLDICKTKAAVDKDKCLADGAFLFTGGSAACALIPPPAGKVGCIIACAAMARQKVNSCQDRYYREIKRCWERYQACLDDRKAR